MKKDDSQLSSYDGFINLEELIKLIKKSKLLVAIVTLCFTIAVGFYSAFETHEYFTELKVDIGGNLTSEFSKDSSNAGLEKLKNTLNFYWPTASVEVIIPSFVIIKHIGPKETGKKIIDEIIIYLEKEENNQLKLKRDKVDLDITFWTKKKLIIDKEFNRLLNLDALPNNDSRKDVFSSELLIKKNDLQLEIDKLESQTFEQKLSYEVYTGKQKIVNIYSRLLLSFITGLIISVFLLIIRLAAKSLKTD